MSFKWDGTVGPSTIVGMATLLSSLVGIGVLYGSMNEWRNSTTVAVMKNEKVNEKQDRALSINSERIGKIESTLGLIVPSIQRIEQALQGKPERQP